MYGPSNSRGNARERRSSAEKRQARPQSVVNPKGVSRLQEPLRACSRRPRRVLGGCYFRCKRRARAKNPYPHPTPPTLRLITGAIGRGVSVTPVVCDFRSTPGAIGTTSSLRHDRGTGCRSHGDAAGSDFVRSSPTGTSKSLILRLAALI